MTLSHKSLRIIYWVITLLFCALQGWSALQYMVEAPRMTESITALGYPIYFMKILGVFKLLGIAAILYGRLPTLKEWAYAGFTFDTLGAAGSHFANGDGFLVALVPLAFCATQLTSYFLWKRLAAQPADGRDPARIPAPPPSRPHGQPHIA